MRLNYQSRQFGGFAPAQRVSGRTPEMPICAIGNPHFDDFMNPEWAPAAKTHGLVGLNHKIRRASLNADFINNLNTALRRGERDTKSEESFLCRTVFFYLQIARL